MSGNVYKINFVGRKMPTEIENYPNQEWIIAGIKLLREHGVSGLSIQAICEELGRKIDAFNRTFNGLKGFATALLDFWYERETLKYIAISDEVVGSAEESLLAMMEVIHHADKQDEIAIRNWALKCPVAHSALERVDRTRLDFGIGLFKEMGFSDNESTMRSKVLYTSTIGTEYTSISSSLEQKIATCRLLMQMD